MAHMLYVLFEDLFVLYLIDDASFLLVTIFLCLLSFLLLLFQKPLLGQAFVLLLSLRDDIAL